MEKLQRKSFTTINKIYFWTATIHNWNHLLKDDIDKVIIVDSLKTLSDRGLITIFGFVIMPNHIHLIWQLNQDNGKESAKASFLKFTAHALKKKLKGNIELENYRVDA